MQFRGEYWFLSNMYPCTVKVGDWTFKCAEAAFQAAKCVYKEDIQKLTTTDGFTAKKFGRRVRLRSDWESIKTPVMLEIVSAKFEQNKELMDKLKRVTGIITEDNTWKDTFWGMYNGKGQNWLGKILMSVRDSAAK